MSSFRPHPHVNIPPGAAPPASPSAWSPYAFELNRPAAQGLPNPWGDGSSPNTPMALNVPPRPRSRAVSAYELESGQLSFPEPQVYRAASQRSVLFPPKHRVSQSDAGPIVGPSSPTRAPSIASSVFEFSPQLTPLTSVDNLTEELSNLTLDTEEGLRRFQSGELPESDREWHRLVPPEAREALGSKEVRRQSIIFEVFKSEADYVASLELINEVYIQPLFNANPPVVPPERVRGFVKEVFYNYDEILAHHQRMLGALFERQREQHPLIQSIADIVLDTCLLFQNEYETYIKHYPLAESRHRSELKRNPHYVQFLQQRHQDPRLHKHDVIDFISRPVTRLPRLRLLLEQVLKYTEPDHPDMETIPLLLNIMGDFIKSAEPGIEAANSRVNFWGLCESLVYFKGEIVDMDLYDESRSLVYQGPLARRQRSEVDWHGWNDFFVALLDNYLLLTKEDNRHGTVRHLIMSRPIPLEYLRLGAFDGPSENRKERSEEGGLLDALRPNYRPMYPFTVYHASSKSSRRYTLYASTESVRRKWRDALVDALAVRRVRQEANMWFAPYTLNDGFFRIMPPRVTYNSGTKFTGKITAAASFISRRKRFLAIGCVTGIYISRDSKGTPISFHKVLPLSSPTSMIALQEYNKFIIHHETTLYCYSMDMLARVSQQQEFDQNLEASAEKIGSNNGSVLFFRVGRLGHRTMVFYATRYMLLQTMLHMAEVVDPEANITPQRGRQAGGKASFRPYNQPFSISKDTYDVAPLNRTLAVCADRGIFIVDPAQPTVPILSIPDFSGAYGNQPVISLKQRCDAARPLGVVRCDAAELLVVYDDLGCYITKHGVPSRRAGFLRWETRATSYTHRGDHILLFSPQFIEIRNIQNGRLVQVIEGDEIRLLHSGYKQDDSLLVAMKGGKEDAEGLSEKVVELAQTSAIETPAISRVTSEEAWDEWDMS